MDLEAALALSRDERTLIRYRLPKLRRQLAYCYRRSPLYREKFDRAGVTPDDVRSWEDFRNLPVFLSKEDERLSQERSMAEAGHPYGMHLCVPPEKVLGISATSGTTGEPTFTYVNSARDLTLNRRVWGRMLRWLGVGPGETVLHAMGLSMWVLGVPGVMAMIQNRVRPVPVGAEAGAERILKMAALTRPVLMLATPSLVDHLIQRAPDVLGREVDRLGIRKILCMGEPGAGLPEFRSRIEGAYGAEVYDGRGLAWGVAMISCRSEEYQGMHELTPDITIGAHDLVDPATHQPIALEHGATGKLLVTHLEREARPAIRFDMGDIHQVLTKPCGCGRPGNRVKVLGRADDMLIIKGVNVYPAAIKNVIQGFVPRVTGNMRVMLDAPPPAVVPPLIINVELAARMAANQHDALRREIEERIQARLRFRPKVRLLAAGSLGSTTGKTPLIERNYQAGKS